MGFWTTRLPPAAAQYIFLECQLFTSYWALLETKALTRSHLVLFCTQVPKMPWVRHASWQKFSTVTDTSFIKWKWYLQGRAKPDLKAFSRLPKDVASNMLSPLPENLVELVAVPPLPHPLATWEVPWDQLSAGQGVAILHQWQCHHCKGCSSREGHGILPGLRHVSIEQGTPSSA